MSGVLVEDREGVRYLSLNRPEKHNAMDDPLVDEFGACLVEAIASDARVIVVRGEGRSFSSGRDTRSLANDDERSALEQIRSIQAIAASMTRSPKPVIAALHGHVLGMACEFALAADIRIAADDTKIGLPEVDHALVTDNGAATRVAVLAGPSRAKHLLMSGAAIDAATALSWGLVDRVVPSADLHDATHELASSLARKSPLALAVAKELIDQVHAGPIAAGIRSEGLAQLVLLASEDHHELQSARREDRPPVFRGR